MGEGRERIRTLRTAWPPCVCSSPPESWPVEETAMVQRREAKAPRSRPEYRCEEPSVLCSQPFLKQLCQRVAASDLAARPLTFEFITECKADEAASTQPHALLGSAPLPPPRTMQSGVYRAQFPLPTPLVENDLMHEGASESSWKTEAVWLNNFVTHVQHALSINLTKT